MKWDADDAEKGRIEEAQKNSWERLGDGVIS